jgi:predicted ATPase
VTPTHRRDTPTRAVDPRRASAGDGASLSLVSYAEPSEQAEQAEAVQLFVERVQAAHLGFCLTRANAPAVDELCLRLDGMPLALELAAAWVSVLSVEQVLARLDDRFALLQGGGRRDALPRQQTLRALLEWSHARLSDRERVLLRRLAVFAGDWTLEAAEAVCAGEGLTSSEVLHGLARVVGASLVGVVVEQEDEQPRYRLLETVRAHAREGLRASGEEAPCCRRHLGYCHALVEQAASHLCGPDAARWLGRAQLLRLRRARPLPSPRRARHPDWRRSWCSPACSTAPRPR